MSISSLLNNNKLNIYCIDYRGYRFLIYRSSVGVNRIVLVEEVLSGVREVPTDHPTIDSETSMDNFVED